MKGTVTIELEDFQKLSDEIDKLRKQNYELQVFRAKANDMVTKTVERNDHKMDNDLIVNISREKFLKLLDLRDDEQIVFRMVK